jgi:hypothetical protein
MGSITETNFLLALRIVLVHEIEGREIEFSGTGTVGI